VFLVDDLTSEREDLQLQSIAHGVVSLEQLSPEYGAERRRLRIIKLRGQKYRGGYHDFVIQKGGLEVFPRLVAGEHDRGQKRGLLQAGNKEVDALLGGGLQYGNSVVLLGPAGSGKSTLTLQYARAAADRGERAIIFAFDERVETILERTAGLGMDLTKHLDSGHIAIQTIDTAELSPGEFAHRIRRAAEGEAGKPGVKVMVIDSLNGYLNAMPEERFLTIQLHELLTYLGHKGVVTFLVVAQHGLVGAMQTPIDTTYLADTVILFRYFEAMGEVRQAVSVLKKRSGKHERTIREMSLGANGITIGQPLKDFQGYSPARRCTAVPTRRSRGRRMNDERPEQLEMRVLVLAPTARDAATSRTSSRLRASAVSSATASRMSAARRGAGRGGVVTVEAVLGDKDGALPSCSRPSRRGRTSPGRSHPSRD
jgi:circadian clock protein KaiC